MRKNNGGAGFFRLFALYILYHIVAYTGMLIVSSMTFGAALWVKMQSFLREHGSATFDELYQFGVDLTEDGTWMEMIRGRYILLILSGAALLTIAFSALFVYMDRRRRRIAGAELSRAEMQSRPGRGLLICFGVFLGVGMSCLYILMEIAFQDGGEWILIAGNSLSIGRLLAAIFVIGILSPVGEELFFRGVIYDRLRSAKTRNGIIGNIGMAVLYSGLLYGLQEPVIGIMLLQVVLGVLLALVYEMYNSLRACVYVNMAVSICVVTIAFLVRFWPLFRPIYLCAGAVVGLFIAAAVFLSIWKAGGIKIRDDSEAA